MTQSQLLLDYMEKHQDEFINKLKDAVVLESPSNGDKDDLEICREYFKKLFESIGFKATVVPSNDEHFGDHLLLEYGEGDEQILFVGHYDTVYPKGTFQPLWVIEANTAHGPGVLDMKGGDVQVYMVAKALIELGLMPINKRIVFFLSSDEETGSLSSSDYYITHAKQSKAAFVMESAKGDYIGGLKIGRYSRGMYTFVASGKQAHSGLEAYKSDNAIRELSQQAIALQDLTFYDNYNYETVTVYPTCFESGNASWCTVPGDGRLTIDVRSSTEDLMKIYNDRFMSLQPFNPKIKIETIGGINKPPFDKDIPDNKALYEKALAVGKEFGIEMRGQVVVGGSDGNFTSYAGCPTLDGMGMTGDFVHNTKEYINLNSVAKRGAFVAKMVLEVLKD